MKILGIDYGKAKIGLAIGEGKLSEPLKVVRVNSFDDAIEKIEKEILTIKPEKIVVGISEGAMGTESKKFSLVLTGKTAVPVETLDETLSTRDAQELSKLAGINRKKRHQMEDAFAASVMLQSYLDDNNV